MDSHMIYTVTCNPSLDYIVFVDKFQTGMTNRTRWERIVPGGKGINVSIVLHHLGVPSTALGFLAGFTGEEIQRRTKELGILPQWIFLEEGCSRINVKLNDTMGRSSDISRKNDLEENMPEGTEINGRGPDIPSDKLNELKLCLKQLQKEDVLVLAGSIPSSVPASLYEDLMSCVKEKQILTIVDAAGTLLRNILPLHPFLIKPNRQELGELFRTEIHTREEAVPYAKKLQRLGARNVLVSLAGSGAVLAAENGQVYSANAPKGRLVNGVGAGDSMVAGFLAGWMETKDYAHAFRMGLAAGSASAFADHLAAKEEIQAVYNRISEEIEDRLQYKN